jgi:hypothetical protein
MVGELISGWLSPRRLARRAGCLLLLDRCGSRSPQFCTPSECPTEGKRSRLAVRPGDRFRVIGVALQQAKAPGNVPCYCCYREHHVGCYRHVPAVWSEYAADPQTARIPAAHFLPEEAPIEVFERRLRPSEKIKQAP